MTPGVPRGTPLQRVERGPALDRAFRGLLRGGVDRAGYGVRGGRGVHHRCGVRSGGNPPRRARRCRARRQRFAWRRRALRKTYRTRLPPAVRPACLADGEPPSTHSQLAPGTLADRRETRRRSAARRPSLHALQAFDDAGYRASLPSRTFLFGGGVPVGERPLTLVTFTPAFPTRPWSCCPSLRSSVLSWGCPKIAPPSCRSPGSPLPEGAPANRHLLPSEKSSQLSSCSDLVVSHHLAGLLLPGDARVLQRASDPGVHCVSARDPTRTALASDPRRAPRFPAVRSCPSKLFPRVQQPTRRSRAEPTGGRHRRDSHLPRRSPNLLAPPPLPPPRVWEPKFPPTRRRPDLGALLRTRIRCAPRRCRLDPPDAPLGLDAARLDPSCEAPVRASSVAAHPKEGACGRHHVRQRPFEKNGSRSELPEIGRAHV